VFDNLGKDRVKFLEIWGIRNLEGTNMLIKLSSKNQITVPRKILARLPNTKYFEVELKDGALVLKPVEVVETNLKQIRQRMDSLGLEENCVAEAIRWARSR
jgi:hypothetical protein